MIEAWVAALVESLREASRDQPGESFEGLTNEVHAALAAAPPSGHVDSRVEDLEQIVEMRCAPLLTGIIRTVSSSGVSNTAANARDERCCRR